MSKSKYDDILNMKYPDKEIEKDFPDEVLRAAQFAPFAALTGHDEAILETARITSAKLELDECAKTELNRKLNILKDNLINSPEVSITYFLADKKKDGGKYVIKKGIIKKIRDFESDIVFEDNTEVLIDDILHIESKVFGELN